MHQKALREHILTFLYVGVCGFLKRLKLHLQNTLGTERLGLRLSEGQWGLSLGLVRVEWGGTASTPQRPSAQTSIVVNGPWKYKALVEEIPQRKMLPLKPHQLT